MKKLSLMKKFLAFSLALVTAVTVLANGGSSVIKNTEAAATSAEAKQNVADIEQAQKDISDLESKQKSLDEKIAKAQDGIQSEQEKQNDISSQIDLVQKTIQKYDETIKKYEDNIKQLSENIAKSEKNIKTKEQEIEKGVEDFKTRIRVMYIAGSDSYSDILIGAEDFYDMLMKIELVKRVANHDNNMINNLVDLKHEYEAEKKKQEDDKKDLEDKKKAQQAEKDKKQKQKDKLSGLYKQSKAAEDKLKSDEKIFKVNQAKLKKEQDEFEANLQALYKQQEAIKQKEAEEAERKRQEELARQRQQQQQQNNQNNNNYNNNGGNGNSQQPSNDNSDYGHDDKSQFSWPVPGFYNISYGIGWRWGAYHQGIDIWSEGIRGANICAAADGTVIQVANGCSHDYGKNGSCGCGGGYGNYCIIDHGNGYWTLYGHSEGITVSVGQTVKQGDVIGTVGSTGYSTGPHLHFEVRLNGVAQDPQNYV